MFGTEYLFTENFEYVNSMVMFTFSVLNFSF